MSGHTSVRATAEQMSVGDRVRASRRYRGMSLKTLAGLAGVSVGWLSEVENGKRTVDRRSHFTALANALRVAVSDLTGQPLPPANPEHSQAHAAVPSIRLALMTSSLDEPLDVVPRPIEQAAAEVRRAATLAQACEFAELGGWLPGLLTDLHAHAAAHDEQSRTRALRLLATACQAAWMHVKRLGYPDLMWMAAERHAAATARLADPVWCALSEFLRAHVLLPIGAPREAQAIARRAADGLSGNTSDPVVAQVYGMLLLTDAFAASAQGKPSSAGADQLREATNIAARLGDQDAFHLAFGPANVAAWRVAIGVENGDGPKVVEYIEHVDLSALPSASRQSHLYADLGRGLAEGRNRENEAVAMLCHAERLAPQWAPSDPLLRQTVVNLLGRPRIATRNRELRGLAYRLGVA